jgi:hypothetical protein
VVTNPEVIISHRVSDVTLPSALMIGNPSRMIAMLNCWAVKIFTAVGLSLGIDEGEKLLEGTGDGCIERVGISDSVGDTVGEGDSVGDTDALMVGVAVLVGAGLSVGIFDGFEVLVGEKLVEGKGLVERVGGVDGD